MILLRHPDKTGAKTAMHIRGTDPLERLERTRFVRRELLSLLASPQDSKTRNTRERRIVRLTRFAEQIITHLAR